MAAKKKPSAAQLAARAKFVAMVRAKSKAKKSATKKISGTKKKATKLPSLFDKPISRQTGTSNKVKDSMRKALAPGKRKSATGKTYTERRANRSDKPGSLTGMKGLKKLSGVAPHKAKYFIDFIYQGIERTEYFDKLPKDRYKATTGILYVTRLTDYGTALCPLLSTKTNLPIKK
jgi:hypothetical protein